MDVLVFDLARVNPRALDAAIKEAVGDVYSGHSGPGSKDGRACVCLHFVGAVKFDVVETAKQIAFDHDYKVLTVEQQAAKDQQDAVKLLHAELASRVDDPLAQAVALLLAERFG